jgi:hypothetical protein
VLDYAILEQVFPEVIRVSLANPPSPIALYPSDSTLGMCYSPDHAEHHHILGPYIRTCITDMAVAWFQSKEVKFLY